MTETEKLLFELIKEIVATNIMSCATESEKWKIQSIVWKLEELQEKQ